ncbi:heme ABC transporter ATP-binding protein [Microbaculum marinum]|uniref:Heme ABC transporter ATP-binding protein n=1 Tax=Microbaculum marinum TaxID=1764581 RepID=A0AAW9RUE8_9HYPH
MIEARGISVRLAGREVLREATLGLSPGELAVVVGPNGAGKTTLLRALVGDLQPWGGEVLFDGVPLSRWHGRDLARRRAVLSQSQHLAFPFTVHEVVSLGLRGGRRGLRAGAEPVASDMVVRTLGRVGLAGYEGRFYQQLSGGEQQRVHLARVLCQLGRPVEDGKVNWLFLDEPTASLDIRHQFEILDLARQHVRAGGGGLAILHDLRLASDYADRVIVVDDGRTVANGPPAATLTADLIERVFGVRADRILALPQVS